MLLAQPFPYKSALAFVNDIDTATFNSFYKAYSCFFGMNPRYDGIGLDITSSFWITSNFPRRKKRTNPDFYILASDYEERQDIDVDWLVEFLRSPIFDTLHTYGQFKPGTFSRSAGQHYLEYLEKNDFQIKCWTYHGAKNQQQNIYPKSDFWAGDDPKRESYHLDLLLKYGIRYFRIPPAEFIGASHNEIEPLTCRDGSQIISFRGQSLLGDSTSSSQISSWLSELEEKEMLPYDRTRVFQPSGKFPFKLNTWKAELLPWQLSDEALKKMCARGGAFFLNQHMTQSFSVGIFENERVVKSLQRLQTQQDYKNILVSSTQRLLDFAYLKKYMKFVYSHSVDHFRIEIENSIGGPILGLKLTDFNLDGLSFSIETELPIKVYIEGKYVNGFIQEKHNDRFVVYFPWRSDIHTKRDALISYKKCLLDQKIS